MGIIICPVHGRSPIVETCAHVAEKIERRQAPTGHRLTILGDLLVCDACFDQLGFDRTASLEEAPIEPYVNDERWQAYEAAYDRLETRAVFCLECVCDLDMSFGR